MNALLVTFDLNSGDSEPKVHTYLQGFDSMRLSGSAYAIATERSPETIYQELRPLLGKDDLAYVITLAKPWIGYGYEAMHEWLSRHITHSTSQMSE